MDLMEKAKGYPIDVTEGFMMVGHKLLEENPSVTSQTLKS